MNNLYSVTLKIAMVVCRPNSCVVKTHAKSQYISVTLKAVRRPWNGRLREPLIVALINKQHISTECAVVQRYAPMSTHSLYAQTGPWSSQYFWPCRWSGQWPRLATLLADCTVTLAPITSCSARATNGRLRCCLHFVLVSATTGELMVIKTLGKVVGVSAGFQFTSAKLNCYLLVTRVCSPLRVNYSTVYCVRCACDVCVCVCIVQLINDKLFCIYYIVCYRLLSNQETRSLTFSVTGLFVKYPPSFVASSSFKTVSTYRTSEIYLAPIGGKGG